MSERKLFSVVLDESDARRALGRITSDLELGKFEGGEAQYVKALIPPLQKLSQRQYAVEHWKLPYAASAILKESIGNAGEDEEGDVVELLDIAPYNISQDKMSEHMTPAQEGMLTRMGYHLTEEDKSTLTKGEVGKIIRSGRMK